MSTVQEIKAAIESLSPAQRIELERLLRKSSSVLDPEADTLELETELLKGVSGLYSPYSDNEMRAIIERVIREESRE